MIYFQFRYIGQPDQYFIELDYLLDAAEDNRNAFEKASCSGTKTSNVGALGR